MKKFIVILLLCFPICLWAFDFGVDLNQEFDFSGIKDDTTLDYTAALIPHFSASLSSSADLYISAAFEAVYEYEEFSFVPELLRTEILFRFDDFRIKVGRVPYADPLGFTVEGFFDGVQVLYDTSIGTFNVGGWYTGLLYKRDANITMTANDYDSYYIPLDYSKFLDTYFASRRVLAAVGWEHPSIAQSIRLRAAVFGQYDLNDTDTLYHSMYISAKAAVPVKQFIITIGGCMQMAKVVTKVDEETGIGLAGELAALWIVPTSFYSQLSLIGRISSGKSDSIAPFVPITAKPQGDVLEANISGISAFYLDYAAQLHKTVLAGLTASYFIRDGETYAGYPLTGTSSGIALGGEFFARVTWNPLTDVSLNLGAGIFLPIMGDVSPDADPQWRVQLALRLVIY
ncbi:hypothetical protein R84B8_00577 [Treponema sp. R8-4-B8]